MDQWHELSDVFFVVCMELMMANVVQHFGHPFCTENCISTGHDVLTLLQAKCVGLPMSCLARQANCRTQQLRSAQKGRYWCFMFDFLSVAMSRRPQATPLRACCPKSASGCNASILCPIATKLSLIACKISVTTFLTSGAKERVND